MRDNFKPDYQVQHFVEEIFGLEPVADLKNIIMKSQISAAIYTCIALDFSHF